MTKAMTPEVESDQAATSLLSILLRSVPKSLRVASSMTTTTAEPTQPERLGAGVTRSHVRLDRVHKRYGIASPFVRKG
jgi:hypothetical protein